MKIEGIRIAGSPAAPLLTLIVGPSAEGREVGEVKKDRAGRYQVRKLFWTALLDHARSRTKLHGAISPTEYSWVGTSAGVSGLGLNCAVTQHGTSVELYIDRGRGAERENEAIFDSLAARRETIEGEFGGPLSWERLEGKRACRIAQRFDDGGYKDNERWPQTRQQMTDAMVRLERALRPRLDELPV